MGFYNSAQNNPVIALIVDDELHSRQRLSRLLREVAPEITGIAEATNQDEAISKIERFSPNIIFVATPTNDKLSQQLMTGVAGTIPKISVCKDPQQTSEIITEFGGFYLEKPVDAQHLRDLLDALSNLRKRIAMNNGVSRAVEISADEMRKASESLPRNVQAYLNRLVVRRQGRFRLLPVEKVIWFGTEYRLVYAYTERRRYPIDLGLEQLEKRLDPELFVRIHRSAIVNTARIADVQPVAGGRSKIVLNDTDKRTLPLSASRARPIKDLLRNRDAQNLL
jgi:two-component system LytT family response regulator